MSESLEHSLLVEKAYRYICDQLDSSCQGSVLCDKPGYKRPFGIEGNYIPDVYYLDWGDVLFIGEAKSISDFDSKHSQMQIEKYMQECAAFSGDATLVISVPYKIIPHVYNRMRKLKKRNNFLFKIVILNENGAPLTV